MQYFAYFLVEKFRESLRLKLNHPKKQKRFGPVSSFNQLLYKYAFVILYRFILLLDQNDQV